MFCFSPTDSRRRGEERRRRGGEEEEEEEESVTSRVKDTRHVQVSRLNLIPFPFPASRDVTGRHVAVTFPPTTDKEFRYPKNLKGKKEFL